MALVKCPDCGKEVSDAAPACPGCGRPMAAGPAAAAAAAAPPAKPKSVFSGVLLALIVFFIVIPIGGVITCVVCAGGAAGIHAASQRSAEAAKAEAYNSLGQIGKNLAAEYEKESMAGVILQPGQTVTRHLCPSASQSVPASLSMVSGKRYQSTEAEWLVDKARNAGFACLKFSMDYPQSFMYSYESTDTTFTATAEGDLNGDGVPSRFILRGHVDSSGALYIEPNIEEHNPNE